MEALKALHELRSIIHVVDMHQLTKDPERFNADFERTDQSAEVGMNATDMASYLDYCSEMLSLVGKTAALYAERTTDSAVP